MKKKFRRNFFYYLLVVTRALLHLLPTKAALWLGGAVGRLTFRFPTKERKKTLTHLTMAFGHEKLSVEIETIGREVFAHLGTTFVEWCLIDRIKRRLDDWVTTEGGEKITEILKGGKGGIGIVAHFGNWELMGGWLAMKGFPVTVVARRIYYEKYDKALVSMREGMKVRTLYRDGSVREMLKVLKDGGILAIVADQDVESVQGVFVNFFGRPAYTPVAPSQFAYKTGAPIAPAFIIREGGKHRIIIEDPIPFTSSGDEAADILAHTQKWTSIHEKYIRKYPHLWVWNHARWKTQNL